MANAEGRILDLTTHRARSIAVQFMLAYDRQRDAMRIAGIPSSQLALGDDGQTIVADVAACMTVATTLSRAGLTSAVLDRMRAVEEGAFAALARAAEAYFSSRELRAGLGRMAEAPFRQLREGLP